jgi:hypothetical protein
MSHKKLKLSVVLIFVLGLTRLQAQEALTASVGEALGSGGSSSYSVGQMVYTNNTDTNGSVSQGVQQIYTISVVSGLEDELAANILLTVSPNPTSDFLNLLFEDFKIEEMNYQLFDLQGKLLETNPVKAIQTQISMNHLPSAVYVIHVIRENQIVKSFRILKN